MPVLRYPVVATAVFNALADGGTESMALQPMFWAKIFGMLNDKFGTPWLINGELQAAYGK
jgi:PhnB protein